MLRLYRGLLALLIGAFSVSAVKAETPFAPETELGLQLILRDYSAFVDRVGLSLFVSDGTRTFSGVSGLADRQDDLKMLHDAQFRVGSHTKTVVAILALQLVDAGFLSLDDRFGRYFPEYPRFAEIRVADLLGMRSGIPEYLNSAWGIWALATTPKQPRKAEDLLGFVKAEKLEFVPGSACHYSNSNYLAVGMILEKITGKSVAQLIDERIVSPLGLTSTFLDEGNRLIPRLARGYLDVNLGASIWDMSPIFYYAFDQLEQMGDGLVDATYHLHPTLAGPTGALISTPEDMTKILRALFEGKLVSREALVAMMEAHDCILADEQVEYGMGLFRWDSPHGLLYGHGGITFGFRTGTFHHVDRGITFSLMSNYYPDQLEPFVDEMLRVLAGKVTPPSAACDVADDYFDVHREDVLNLSFRGPIIYSGNQQLGSGVVKIRRHGRLYQLHTKELSARRRANGSLSIDGVGSRQGGNEGLMRATLILTPEATGGLSAQSGLAILEDLEVLPESDGITRACVRSVGDFSRPAADIKLCDPEVLNDPQDGKILRLFARVPMTSNSDKIAESLSTLDISALCACSDRGGASIPCPRS